MSMPEESAAAIGRAVWPARLNYHQAIKNKLYFGTNGLIYIFAPECQDKKNLITMIS